MRPRESDAVFESLPLGSGAPADRCVHFGECGGCDAQDVPYARQLEAKAAALGELFASFWDWPIAVHPSPVLAYYRNRVDLAFGRKFYDEPPPRDFERETVLGFKRKGRWYAPLEISECRIFSPELPGLLDGVRAWVARHNLKAYNSRRDEGFLRILLVREGKRTGERMVVLTTRDEPVDPEGFSAAVRERYPATSVYWGVFSGKAEITAADRLDLLYGAETLEERLRVPDGSEVRELRFLLSPLSFFQTNTLATEVLYGRIRDWVKERPPRVLYDLYGGSGGIAFSCADLVERVVSVESFEPASLDGVRNAALNGIGNVSFQTAEVERYLRETAESGGFEPDSAAVVDPPRAGLHPKALRRLCELGPSRLMYVSCKPTVLAKEMPELLEAFDLRRLEAVDLFPHTPHVEVLASFEAR